MLQRDNPGVVPVIAVADLKLGDALGAPAAAVVPTGADIVGLFNSAASRAGGRLATTSPGAALGGDSRGSPRGCTLG